MEMLLDINNQPHIDASVRYDLGLDNTFDEEENDPEITASLIDMQPELEARALRRRDLAMFPPQKSLPQLLQQRPPYDVDVLSQADRDAIFIPETCLTTDQLDEAINEYDESLGFPLLTAQRTSRPRQLSDKELETQNPSSVYSWLRKNESQVFLQDADSNTTGKQTTNRAAGKKTAQPTPSNHRVEDVGAMSEDDDMDSESHATPMLNKKSASKRKRAPDEDVGYRPKGSSRPSKKKKADSGARKSTSGGTPGSAKPKKEREDVAMGDGAP